MRTSAAGSSTERRRGASRGLRTACPRGARGFTLFELLVVLAVVGVVLAAVTLSLRGDRREDLLAEEAERLRALIRLAREEAVLRGEARGLRLRRDGYAFLARDDKGWRALAEDAVLRPRQIAPELRLRLSVDGLPAEDLDWRTHDGPLPDVVLWTSGEVTPFRLVLALRDGEAAWSLDGSARGELLLSRVDPRG